MRCVEDVIHFQTIYRILAFALPQNMLSV